MGIMRYFGGIMIQEIVQDGQGDKVIKNLKLDEMKIDSSKKVVGLNQDKATRRDAVVEAVR